jgi:hypothetical protein
MDLIGKILPKFQYERPIKLVEEPKNIILFLIGVIGKDGSSFYY